MRTLILSLLTSVAFSAEVNKPSPKEAPAPVQPGMAEAPPAPRATDDNDLQNLSACARMVMKDLTPEQMQAVAIAIKHAEDDVQAIRKAKAVPVEVKK